MARDKLGLLKQAIRSRAARIKDDDIKRYGYTYVTYKILDRHHYRREAVNQLRQEKVDVGDAVEFRVTEAKYFTDEEWNKRKS